MSTVLPIGVMVVFFFLPTVSRKIFATWCSALMISSHFVGDDVEMHRITIIFHSTYWVAFMEVPLHTRHLHPLMMSYCSSFDRGCESYDSGNGETVEFLLNDPSIQCGTDAHTELKIISVFLILLW